MWTNWLDHLSGGIRKPQVRVTQIGLQGKRGWEGDRRAIRGGVWAGAQDGRWVRHLGCGLESFVYLCSVDV